MKNLLVLSGSPHGGGRSAQMADCFLSSLQGWQPEIIRPYALDIKPCTDCGFCSEIQNKERHCCLGDDMSPLYAKIDAADGLLVASPVYFFSLPAPLKMFIDRLQPYWCRRILHKQSPPPRPGAALLCGGAPAHEGQFSHSEAVISGAFRELGVQPRGFVGFSNGDRQELDSDAKEKIRSLAESFK